jgi:signal transduction histidine kinase/ActR/RegA family two-component response regulator
MPLRDRAGAIVKWFGSNTDVEDMKLAEQHAEARSERLNLLHQITRAIGERQDLGSIFQVAIRSVEDQLPADFCCLCLHDPSEAALTVAGVGARSEALAASLAMPERARIDLDGNGLARCLRGMLVYEPDLAKLDFPFPRRLVQGGLGAAVFAPLQVESNVFGVLIVARRTAASFSSGENEFLRQLSEHVALAAHQSQLYEALQRAYEDLRQSQQTVMQQERLRALGQMASGIAHDINNALTPASLYAESLLEDQTLNAQARKTVEVIDRAIGDVAHTVARMREFYRHHETQLELLPVGLNELVRQVVGMTQARWRDMPMQRGIVIDIALELADDLPPVMGIESEIREALINLVTNAVDAMPDGGRIGLRTDALPGMLPGASGGRVRVEVSDQGTGMDEETRQRCLEPFFTTKGERGTGLGLAMVYGVVRRHDAEIEIDSAPGRGTTVRVFFAVAERGLSRPEEHQDRPAEPRPRLHLLLIDDDPLLLKSLSDILESEGHSIVAANGGQAGIDAFKAASEEGKTFAAVITDLGMPHIDGRRVAGAIKALSPETPIILLTGWGQRLIAEDDIPTHVDRVLSKPPRLRDLREALAALRRKPTPGA